MFEVGNSGYPITGAGVMRQLKTGSKRTLHYENAY